MKLFLNAVLFALAVASLLEYAHGMVAVEGNTGDDAAIFYTLGDRKLQDGGECNVGPSRPLRIEQEFCTILLSTQGSLSADPITPTIVIITTTHPTQREHTTFPGTFEPGCDPGVRSCQCILTPETIVQLDEWKNGPVPEPQITGRKCQGKIKGEPHVKAFDGTKYDFHSECDLVATSSPSFGEGAGLDIHIRTTLNGNYAYTSGAVLRIGSDFLEVDASMNIWNNNAPVWEASLPSVFAGYPLVKDDMWYRIWLNEYENIGFASPVGMLKVEVNAVLPGASGLVGTTGTPGLIGRDGTTVLTPEQMGQEWQVGPMDHAPMFSMARAPQYPAQCILPSVSSVRRLGEEAALRRMAEEACTGVTDPEEMDDCIYDVIQTGDSGLAADYFE